MDRFVALDFETSGVDPRRHAPIQLGVVMFENGEPGNSHEWLIAPTKTKKGLYEREFDIAAMEVSRIGWKALKAAPSPEEIAAELTLWVKANDAKMLPVVAYRASFDHAFYSEFLWLASSFSKERYERLPFLSPLLGGWHCAMELAKALIPRDAVPDYKLDSVASVFGECRNAEKHGAEEDARIAGRVFWGLLEKLKSA